MLQDDPRRFKSLEILPALKFPGVPLSGIRLKISKDKVNRCMISNKMYDPLKTYKVLTTNYLASGEVFQKNFPKNIF